MEDKESLSPETGQETGSASPAGPAEDAPGALEGMRAVPDEAERRRQDAAAFIRAYPRVNAGDIPEEVWRAVAAGESLVDAYRAYEFETLRRENLALQERLAKETRSRLNRERSAGSQRSAGTPRPLSDWERAWYSD